MILCFSPKFSTPSMIPPFSAPCPYESWIDFSCPYFAGGIALGCDHAGYELKESLKNVLMEMAQHPQSFWQGSLEEFRSHRLTQSAPKPQIPIPSTDYPLHVPFVVQHVKHHHALGILICNSGIGMSIAANRFPGIRAALCREEQDALSARQHNDANVLILAQRSTSLSGALCMVKIFGQNAFHAERHQRRLSFVEELSCLEEKKTL